MRPAPACASSSEKGKHGREKDPLILKTGLALSVSKDAIAKITLAVMGNLVDNTTPDAADKVMWMADKALSLADPLLRPTPAAA